jgi:hypothetical protein
VEQPPQVDDHLRIDVLAVRRLKDGDFVVDHDVQLAVVLLVHIVQRVHKVTDAAAAIALDSRESVPAPATSNRGAGENGAVKS